MRPGSSERIRNKQKRANNKLSKNLKRKSGGRARKADPVLKGILRSRQDDGATGKRFMNGMFNKFKNFYNGILNLCTPDICFQPSYSISEIIMGEQKYQNKLQNVLSEATRPDDSHPKLLRKSPKEQMISAAGLSKAPPKETTVNSSSLTCPLNEVTASEREGLYDDNGEDVEEIKEDIPAMDLSGCGSYLSVTVKQEKETEDTRTVRDTVNDNLLRLTRQGNQEEMEIKWLEDHYYFVVDTNVLLQQITFVEELKEMKLCGTNGTVCYIPNSVLRELEILKRCASGDEKLSAKRAMNYLNLKFQTKDKHFQIQTDASEEEHLIEINSEEDSKINCCLYVKSKVTNVVLLTEDINLIKRAFSNDVLVSSKMRLTAPPAIQTSA